MLAWHTWGRSYRTISGLG